jgi:hypothetical protein
MSLVDVDLKPRPTAMPASVRAFLHEADRRIERYQQNSSVHGFVPSDHGRVFGALQALAESALAPGGRFCEWGSGFGVVTCLAAMIGFDACGIEIESELVDAARRLAEDFELSAEFVCGSFIPRGGECCLGDDGDYAWLTTRGDDLSGELGLSPDEVDAVYVYPWPDEERAVSAVFERYAAAGAVLLSYHGGEDFRLRRKTARRRR